jgi:Cu(I)/Ag(I) efflux system protein CusF
MIHQFASLLAAAALAGCANEPVAWSVPAGSVADAAYQASAFTPPPNVFAGPIHVAESPVMSMAGMSHGSMAGMSGMDHSKMDHGAMQKAADTKSGSVAATGTVRAIDPAKGTLKIAHEAIHAIGWPAMVMDFPVQNGVDLSKVKEGDRVAFTLKSTGKDEYVIDSVKPAGAAMDHAKMPGMDHSNMGGSKP